VTGLLKSGPAQVSSSQARQGQIETHHAELMVRPSSGFKELPAEVKNAIHHWVQDLNHVALKNPQRTLETIVIPGYQKQLSQTLVQLSAFILRNFLAKNNLTFEYEVLRSFMEENFIEIVKTLEQWMKENKPKELT
jgi:hypothetical protein